MTTPTLTEKERIDNYIGELPANIGAVCQRLREIILSAVPGIKEEWKWGPNYNYNGMVCGFGGFKQHVKLTFFNGSAMKDSNKLFNHCVDNEFSRSIKYTSLNELDEPALIKYLKESAEINTNGWKRTVTEKTIEVPADITEVFTKDETAYTFFNNVTYGYKK